MNDDKKLKFPTPADFAKYVSNNKWKLAPHLKLINKHLVRASLRKKKKLMFNLPPRHGKSEFISKYFPAWYLGNFPEHRLIFVSYNQRFASGWGRRVRDLITEYGKDLFDITVNPGVRSGSGFELLGTEGGMSCTGVGGTLTGKGANILIIDDPIKNDKEAGSIVIRDNIWEWFKSTAFTRLEPDGVIIIIMTRWHEDDLCGRLFNPTIFDDKEITDKWEIVSIPAIAGENDILRRKPGDALWKQRFPIDRLNEIKKYIGSYWFAAQYQQTPAPAEGSVFNRKHFNYFYDSGEYYCLRTGSKNIEKNILKSRCISYATVDLAVSLNNNSDYTVALLFAVTPDNDILILDIIRERMEGSEHLDLLYSIRERWHPNLIGVEKNGYQASLIQIGMKEGLNIEPLNPYTNKRDRAIPISVRMENDMVFFRQGAPWLQDFEDELLVFPNGRHDDQVDAFAYTALMLKISSGAKPAGVPNRRRKGGGLAERF